MSYNHRTEQPGGLNATPSSQPDFGRILAKGLSAVTVPSPASTVLTNTDVLLAATTALGAQLVGSAKPQPQAPSTVIDPVAFKQITGDVIAQQAEIQALLSQFEGVVSKMEPGPQKAQAQGLLSSARSMSKTASPADIARLIDSLRNEVTSLNQGASFALADQAERAREEERHRLDVEWEELQETLKDKVKERMMAAGMSEEEANKEAEAFSKTIDEKREEAATLAATGDEKAAMAKTEEIHQEVFEKTGSKELADETKENADKTVHNALETHRLSRNSYKVQTPLIKDFKNSEISEQKINNATTTPEKFSVAEVSPDVLAADSPLSTPQEPTAQRTGRSRKG